jgi:hypothetical protein
VQSKQEALQAAPLPGTELPEKPTAIPPEDIHLPPLAPTLVKDPGSPQPPASPIILRDPTPSSPEPATQLQTPVQPQSPAPPQDTILALLQSESLDDQERGARAVRTDADEHSVSATGVIGDTRLPPLVELLSSASPGVQLEAAAAMLHLGRSEVNRGKLVAAGALPPLVKLLGSEGQEVQMEAVGAFNNLIIDASTTSVAQAREAGAMLALARLMADSANEVCLILRKLTSVNGRLLFSQ